MKAWPSILSRLTNLSLTYRSRNYQAKQLKIVFWVRSITRSVAVLEHLEKKQTWRKKNNNQPFVSGLKQWRLKQNKLILKPWTLMLFQFIRRIEESIHSFANRILKVSSMKPQTLRVTQKNPFRSKAIFPLLKISVVRRIQALLKSQIAQKSLRKNTI